MFSLSHRCGHFSDLFRDYFDESVYFGDLDPLPKSLPAESRPGEVAYAIGLVVALDSFSFIYCFYSARPGEETLDEDLNFQMGSWAKDMMQYFYDRVRLLLPFVVTHEFHYLN